MDALGVDVASHTLGGPSAPGCEGALVVVQAWVAPARLGMSQQGNGAHAPILPSGPRVDARPARRSPPRLTTEPRSRTTTLRRLTRPPQRYLGGANPVRSRSR